MPYVSDGYIRPSAQHRASSLSMDAPANGGRHPPHPKSFVLQPTHPTPLDDLVADVPNVHAPGPPIFWFPHQAHDQAGMRQGGPHLAPAQSFSSSTGLCQHAGFPPPPLVLPSAPAAVPQAPSIFSVLCTWDGCNQAVSATPSGMEKAARSHLMARHGKDEGLSKKGNVEKSCRFDGCRCAKRHCMIAEPHPFHSSNLRTHVVRTHFGGPCKRAAKAE